jgi:hypothetical protein
LSGLIYPHSPNFSAAPFPLKRLLPYFVSFKNLFPRRMFYRSNYTLFYLHVDNSITEGDPCKLDCYSACQGISRFNEIRGFCIIK